MARQFEPSAPLPDGKKGRSVDFMCLEAASLNELDLRQTSR